MSSNPSPSLITPAVRTLALWWTADAAYPAGGYSTTTPVLAVAAWFPWGSDQPRFSCLIAPPESPTGELVAADDALDSDDVAFAIVPAPWPESADRTNLAPVVERLKRSMDDA
jgi:hypothetical protein